ncbi:FecR family protein [Algihabitans sp.]|uniref:FecR family protein n=1 Tax=Algihabitans sp. TaxID=2821514 RepID=UPI003BA90445
MKKDEERLREQAVDLFLQVEERPDDPEVRRARDAFLARGARERRAYASVARSWSAARPQRTRRRQGAAIALAALAAVLVLIVGPDALRWYRADHAAGPSGPAVVTLASGDRVHLDAGSAIIERINERTRQVVLLDGAAHFEVEPDGRPFSVEAGSMTARALGTAFAVERGVEGVSVAVSDGRVEALHAGARVALRAGERLRIDSDGGERRDRLSPEAVAAWRQGRLVLQDTSLATVAEVLERRMAGRVVILDPALAARRVTGVFSLADPLATLRVTTGLYGGSVIAAPPFLTLVLAEEALP